MQGQRPSLRQKKYVDGIHEDIRNASAMKQEPTSPAAPPLPQASDSPAAGSPLPQDWEAIDEENDKQVTCLSGPRPGCGTWSQTHQPMGGQHFTLACHGKALVLANPPFHCTEGNSQFCAGKHPRAPHKHSTPVSRRYWTPSNLQQGRATSHPDARPE